MAELKELLQSADWKKEKHVSVIETPEKVKRGEFFDVSVSVGREIPHPNTTEHHIKWIEVYFLADGNKFPYQIGKLEFTTHGESGQGPNTGTVYTDSQGTVRFKTDKPGTILACSYCNIHGLWQSAKEIKVV